MNFWEMEDAPRYGNLDRRKYTQGKWEYNL